MSARTQRDHLNVKRTGILSAATAILASIALASPASAVQWDRTAETNDANPGGVVKFKAYGDIVRVCDTDKDGYSAKVLVSDGTDPYTITASGNGNCTTVRASDGGRYNLSENQLTIFHLYLTNGVDKHAETSEWYA